MVAACTRRSARTAASSRSASLASNLVAGDTNGLQDVFVHDRQTGDDDARERGGPGAPRGMSDSETPAISADGRFVAFDSMASNLVAGDTNEPQDVFVHDRQTGDDDAGERGDAVARRGMATAGAPAISADGRFVAFSSDRQQPGGGRYERAGDVFVHDRQTGETTRVNVGPGGAPGEWRQLSAVSADDQRRRPLGGVRSPMASNLVAGDTNGKSDVFVHDRQTGETTRVSVGPGGAQGNGHAAINRSADQRGRPLGGVLVRWPAIWWRATRMGTDVFVYDRQTGTTARVSVGGGDVQANGV